MTTDRKYEYHGETRGVEDQAHDLIHDLSRRLDCLWRYNEYIANAAAQPELQEFWRNCKCQEQASIDQLKRLIRTHVNFNCR